MELISNLQNHLCKFSLHRKFLETWLACIVVSGFNSKLIINKCDWSLNPLNEQPCKLVLPKNLKKKSSLSDVGEICWYQISWIWFKLSYYLKLRFLIIDIDFISFTQISSSQFILSALGRCIYIRNVWKQYNQNYIIKCSINQVSAAEYTLFVSFFKSNSNTSKKYNEMTRTKYQLIYQLYNVTGFRDQSILERMNTWELQAPTVPFAYAPSVQAFLTNFAIPESSLKIFNID